MKQLHLTLGLVLHHLTQGKSNILKYKAKRKDCISIQEIVFL